MPVDRIQPQSNDCDTSVRNKATGDYSPAHTNSTKKILIKIKREEDWSSNAKNCWEQVNTLEKKSTNSLLFTPLKIIIGKTIHTWQNTIKMKRDFNMYTVQLWNTVHSSYSQAVLTQQCYEKENSFKPILETHVPDGIQTVNLWRNSKWLYYCYCTIDANSSIF